VAGESGLATLASVVIVAAIFLATAKVWRNPDRAAAPDEAPAPA
jgi:hypothetical protein